MKNLILATFLLATVSCGTLSKLGTSRSTVTPDQALLMFSEFEKVRLSEDGQAIVVVQKRIYEQTRVAVLARKDLKILATAKFGSDSHVSTVVWIDPDNILLQVSYEEGYLMGAGRAELLYRFQVSKSKLHQVFPVPGTTREKIAGYWHSSRLATSSVIDGKYIFITETYFNKTSEKLKLLRLDIFSGEQQVSDNQDNVEEGNFFLDNKSRVRLRLNQKSYSAATIEAKNLSTSTWQPAIQSTELAKHFKLIGFNKQNSGFYYTAPNTESLETLYYASLDESGKMGAARVVFTYKEGDIHYVVWDDLTSEPMFVDYGFDKPLRKYLSSSAPAKTVQEIEKIFPDDLVYPIKFYKKELLFAVYSSRRPSTTYVFDPARHVVTELVSTNTYVHKEDTVDQKAISYVARDKTLIRGYLTSPKGAGPFPLIISIHGGPYGIADAWGYDGRDQYLARNGFAVLKVNYRGSGGRGLKFERLGYKKQGTAMQADIADAASWAIRTGVTTAGRVGTWGGSYGAYSSVMSGLLFPDLISASAAFGGVYNWSSHLTETDGAGFATLTGFSKEAIADTEEERAAQSAISKANQLKNPLFIAHGVRDVRCTVNQARALQTALLAQQKVFKYKEYENTGHWFTIQEDHDAYFAELLEFFKTNLQGNQNKNATAQN